jgi:transcriptional regulator with XRE-family HTH domain
MSQLRQKFAQRLKTLRHQKGITQEDLARSTGLSVSFIRSIEQELNAPSFESIEAIARSLSVKEKELFDFDNS